MHRISVKECKYGKIGNLVKEGSTGLLVEQPSHPRTEELLQKMTIGNRFPKLEFPRFNGNNLEEVIYMSERYF